MLDRLLNTSVACLQTVPDSANLYKNSFTYDTVEQLPPDFAACNKFIGVTTEAWGSSGCCVHFVKQCMSLQPLRFCSCTRVALCEACACMCICAVP